MELGLAGKRVAITGGSRGIGRAIATRMLEEGASVAICARGQEGVDEALADFRVKEPLSVKPLTSEMATN